MGLFTTRHIRQEHTWGLGAWGLWRARWLGWAWRLGRARWLGWGRRLGRGRRLRVGVKQRVAFDRRRVVLDLQRLDDARALRACALAVKNRAHGSRGHDGAVGALDASRWPGRAGFARARRMPTPHDTEQPLHWLQDETAHSPIVPSGSTKASCMDG